ncbi:hypothetical protein [Georgfuchsia toluolica]|uniref:hypothetical protein n=1 Tax=Georgfuchsia toluolica TaxID=424218 RepID=UPI001C736E3A|nr:hypothetical protein [Georgfuchsia toluolica]
MNRATYIWFVLGTAGYVNTEQAIGIVFSREKTLESMRRLRRLAIAGELRAGELELDAWRRLAAAHLPETEASIVTGYRKLDITPAGIAYLCADPIVDWVVTPATRSNVLGVQAVASDLVYGKTNYLYDCHGAGTANKK